MSQMHVFTSFPDSHEENEDTDNLLGDQSMAQEGNSGELPSDILEEKKYSVWQIEFYQKYFNVSTNDVVARIVGSVAPTLNRSFLLDKIRPNPDLYGPFWICVTLIFSVAISGNILNFFQNFGASSYQWQTDFHKVTVTAAAVFCYWWFMPMIVYTILRWRQNRADFTFIEVLCIYGYSLAIYVPVSILWLIEISFIQWILVIVAALASGSVLMLTFWPAFSGDDRKIGFVVMSMILVFHSILAIGFMVYFFHVPAPATVPGTTTTTTTTTLATSLATSKLLSASSSAAAETISTVQIPITATTTINKSNASNGTAS